MRINKVTEELKQTLAEIEKLEQKLWRSNYEETTLQLLKAKQDYLLSELKGERKKCVKKLKSLKTRQQK